MNKKIVAVATALAVCLPGVLAVDATAVADSGRLTAKVSVVKTKKAVEQISVSGVAFVAKSHPKIKVQIAMADGSKPVGKVTIYVDGKSAATVKIKAVNKGVLNVTLPRSYTKSIKVKAKFIPTNKAVKAKISNTATISVKKASGVIAVSDYGQYVTLANYSTLNVKSYAANADSEYGGVAIGALVAASTFSGYAPGALAKVELALGIFYDDSHTTSEQKTALMKRTNELMMLETFAKRKNLQVTDAEYKATLAELVDSTAGEYTSAKDYEAAFGKSSIAHQALQDKIEQFLVLQIAKVQGKTVTNAEYNAMVTKLYKEEGAFSYKTKAAYEKAMGAKYFKYQASAIKIGAVWPKK